MDWLDYFLIVFTRVAAHLLIYCLSNILSALFTVWLLCTQVPEDMQDKEFAAILQEEPMQPLALVPLTEEEQVRRVPAHGRLAYTLHHTRADTRTHTVDEAFTLT